MTELQIFMAELGYIRGRVDAIATSLVGCQAACGVDRSRRRSWIHWLGGVVAALLPSALLYYVQKR
jgi:hypothetical protein